MASSAWELQARHYVGERHPLVSILYLGLTIGSLMMATHLLLGAQEEHSTYPVMLSLSFLMGIGTAFVTFYEARPLFASAPPEAVQTLVGQVLHPKAQAVIDRRTREEKPLSGIDLWLVLVIQLRASRLAGQ